MFAAPWLGIFTETCNFYKSVRQKTKRFLNTFATLAGILYNSWRASVSQPNDRRCAAMVVVAQLVESRIVIPVVAGSSPVVHPINCACNQGVKSNLPGLYVWAFCFLGAAQGLCRIFAALNGLMPLPPDSQGKQLLQSVSKIAKDRALTGSGPFRVSCLSFLPLIPASHPCLSSFYVPVSHPE